MITCPPASLRANGDPGRCVPPGPTSLPSGASMNFSFFDSMNIDEARDHLDGFIKTEALAIELMRPAAARAGVELSFSIESLRAFFRWILPHIEIIRVPVPETEPDWIREFHKDGLIEFTEESKYLILRTAYYLGECFVRATKDLSWGIGDLDSIEKNMPVITGFRSKMEMAPMMICENVFGGILGDGKPETVIDTMIKSWVGFIP
jgi:hypothetical protein